MLDVGGFRAARRVALTEVAEQAIAQVRESGVKIEMNPLNAFERKVVHDVVAAAGLRSDSEGVDPGRFVVIYPV
jgi:spoIIIJ-associated protein